MRHLLTRKDFFGLALALTTLPGVTLPAMAQERKHGEGAIMSEPEHFAARPRYRIAAAGAGSDERPSVSC